MNFIRNLLNFLQRNQTNDANRDDISGSSNPVCEPEEENIELESTTSIYSLTMSNIESLSTDFVENPNQIATNESRLAFLHSISMSQLDQPKSMNTDASISQFSHSLSLPSSRTVSINLLKTNRISELSSKLSFGKFLHKFAGSDSTASNLSFQSRKKEKRKKSILKKKSLTLSVSNSTQYSLRPKRNVRSVRFVGDEEGPLFATPVDLQKVSSFVDINTKLNQEDILSEYTESTGRSEKMSLTDTTPSPEPPNEQCDESKTCSAPSIELTKEQIIAVDSNIAARNSNSETKIVSSNVDTTFESDNSPTSDIVSIESAKESSLRRTKGFININADFMSITGPPSKEDSSSDIEARDSPTTESTEKLHGARMLDATLPSDISTVSKYSITSLDLKAAAIAASKRHLTSKTISNYDEIEAETIDTSRFKTKSKTDKSKEIDSKEFEISEDTYELKSNMSPSKSFEVPIITTMSRSSLDTKTELKPQKKIKTPKCINKKVSTFVHKIEKNNKQWSQKDTKQGVEKAKYKLRKSEDMATNQEKYALEEEILQKKEALRQAAIEKNLLKTSAELAAERKTDEEFSVDIDADDFRKSNQEIPQARVGLMNYDDVITERIRGRKVRSKKSRVSNVFAGSYSSTYMGGGSGADASVEELQNLISTLKHKKTEAIEGQIASQVSIVPELRFEHPYKVFGITRHFTLPVSIRAAEAQFRDLRRGDLFRMYQDQIDWVEKDNIYIEHETIKCRKQLRSYLIRFFTYDGGRKTHILNNYYFYTLMLFHEINIDQIVDDFTLLEELGPLIGIFIKMFSIIFIDTPITFYVLTMAGISRFGYLKFFDCMPLIRGIGYGMFMVFIVYEAVTSVKFHLGLRCLSQLIANRDNWLNCVTDASGEWNEKCIPFPTNATHNNYCPVKHERWNGTENFASQNFIRYMMTALYIDKTQGHFGYIFINGITVFVWVFIFGITWNGYQRTKRFLSFVQHTVYLIIFAISVSVFTFRIHLESTRHYHPFVKLLDVETMHHILRICLPFLRLPFLIWIATMMPKQGDPEVVSFVLMTVKLGWTIINYFVVQICTFHTIKKYKINSDCFTISYITMIYGLIPDFYSDSIFGSFASALWLCLLNLSVLLRIVYVIQSAIETSWQFIPAFRRFPLLITGIYCLLFIFIWRLHYVKSSSDILMQTFRYELDSCVILMFAVFLLGLKFLYSYQKVQDDYTYIYKRYPNEIWKLWLNVAVFMGLLLIGFVGILEVAIRKVNNITSIFFILGVSSFGGIFVLHHICHYICIGRVGASIQPLASWFDPKVRGDRKFFYSNRNIRVRSNVGKLLSCGSHVCLGQSPQYMGLVLQQKVLNDPEINRKTKVAKILARSPFNERKRSDVSFSRL